MNDRYLYRAKHVHAFDVNKKHDGWVYGFLSSENYIYSPELEGEKLIDPSTICQCTGLKDKNGKLIWENDIMIGHLDDIFPEDATYVRVMWHNNGFCTHQDGYDDYKPLDEFDQNNFEVCGNTVDNPELLEVEE